MFKKLFGHRSAKDAGNGSAPSDAAGESGEQAATNNTLPRWLDADDPHNPFNVSGYDCLTFVNSLTSTTNDPAIAESFLSLRQTIGREYTGKLPDDAVEVSCDLRYEYSGEVAEGQLFKSSQMEEKWDIYLYDERIYFCRSWTGTLALVAQFLTTGTEIVLNRVWAAKEMAEADEQLPVRQVDYLIKSHLFRQAVPHPLPERIAREPQTVGLYSFSEYGRVCCFATYEDTLKAELKTK